MIHASYAPLGKRTARDAQHFLCHGISCLVNGKILPEMGSICRIGIIEQERAKREQRWHARCYAERRGNAQRQPENITQKTI